MKAALRWHDEDLRIDLARGTSLAITLDPHGPQPSFFAPGPAIARPLQVGDYVGDVSRGGSCNAEVIEYIPHCHGTHTECLGHLVHGAGHVLELIDQKPCLAALVSMHGTPAGQTGESCDARTGPQELLLTLEELQSHRDAFSIHAIDALIIRTLPNEFSKRTRNYADGDAYPVLSSECIGWLAGQNLSHLLIDTPSLDRAHDSGRLANHRCWWGLGDKDMIVVPGRATRSVTEMIFVPGGMSDGHYWLNIELQPLIGDAVSSRPVIYPVEFS